MIGCCPIKYQSYINTYQPIQLPKPLQISRSLLIANGHKFHFKTLRNTGKCPFSKQTILFHLRKRWRVGAPSTSQAVPEQSVPSVIPDHDDARKPEEIARITLHYVPVEVLHIGLIREFGLKSYLRGKRTDYLFKHSPRGADARKVVGDDDEPSFLQTRLTSLISLKGSGVTE